MAQRTLVLYVIMQRDEIYQDLDECLGPDQRIVHTHLDSAFKRLQYLVEAGQLRDLWIREYIPYDLKN